MPDLQTQVISDVRAKFDKSKMQTLYDYWKDFHDYLISIKDETITEEIMRTIGRKFRQSCVAAHEEICRTICEHPDGEEREEHCPVRHICTVGGGQGHTVYSEIAKASLERDADTVTLKLQDVPDDSITLLKTALENW